MRVGVVVQQVQTTQVLLLVLVAALLRLLIKAVVAMDQFQGVVLLEPQTQVGVVVVVRPVDHLLAAQAARVS